MKITPAVFDAYLKCPTKCWLRATGESSDENPYAEWVKTQNVEYREIETARLVAATSPDEVSLTPNIENAKAATWHLTRSLTIQSKVESHTAESEIHMVERLPAVGRGKAAQFIPIRFVSTNKLSKDDKLLSAFDAAVLSKELKREIPVGKIIHGDDHVTLKVKTSALAGEVSKRLGKIITLISNPEPPDLVLNRHCTECEFQTRCRKIAVEKDDLSLLARMSEKERQKLRSKGIFTITQLSYTFRPRRRSKRLREKREKYHHSLKALAIREQKIHIVGSPEFNIEGTPVYLDVEGLPDRNFYYLIGVRIGNGESAVQHSLWADTVEDEGRIWQEFLGILETIEKPVLIHYGSYESTFINRMRARIGELDVDSVAARAINSGVNLLSVIYARVYFPTFSNGLKEIVGNLGFRWSDATATGLLTISRHQEWETSREAAIKNSLITYNAGDCAALEVVAHRLFELNQNYPLAGIAFENDVVDTNKLKKEHPYGFKRNTFAFPELDVINNSAYWDYQRDRVYVKSEKRSNKAVRRDAKHSNAARPNRVVKCVNPSLCPKCGSADICKNTKGSKTVLDLKFMRYGIKRWITLYQFNNYLCNSCRSVFRSNEESWSRGKYGSDLVAYAVYLNIELRIPQIQVDCNLNRLFGFSMPFANGCHAFKRYAAETYRASYEALLERLCNGSLLHADETKISIRGKNGFVWVFTSMKEVAYVYSETREGDMIQTLLKNFKGVLVSDFYAVYDAIQCSQQKCLIHLIRDLNDDVLKHPYDEDLKRIVMAFTLLLKPIVETIDRYGLKSHYLRKHQVSVERFYREIQQSKVQSEMAMKVQDRLEKNRDKLFTFLRFDGVPWNNNNAEHAIKPFAALRNVIGGLTTEKGIRDYLVLLSLCQTCKYMGVDFLDFLRSGEKDIHAFAERRPPARHA